MSSIVAAKAAKKAQPMIEQVKPYIPIVVGGVVIGFLGLGGYVLYTKFIKPVTDLPGDIAGIPGWLADLIGGGAEALGSESKFTAAEVKAIQTAMEAAYNLSLEKQNARFYWEALNETGIPPMSPFYAMYKARGDVLEHEIEKLTIETAIEIQEGEEQLLQDQIANLQDQIDANAQWYQEQLLLEQQRFNEAMKNATEEGILKDQYYQDLMDGILAGREDITGFQPPPPPYEPTTVTFADLTDMSWTDFVRRFITNKGLTDEWYKYKVSKGVDPTIMPPDWIKVHAFRLYYEEKI